MLFGQSTSTDARHQHSLCGEWCPYKKAQNNGDQYSHKHSLPEPVMNAMKPTFRALVRSTKEMHSESKYSLNQLIENTVLKLPLHL